MRLDSIHISGFGTFHDWNFKPGPGVTIISGNNEAGKTTLAAYILFILFGFQKHSRNINRYPPLDGGNHGGHADFTMNDGSKITVERILRGNQTVRVITSDHETGDEKKLQDLIGGVDIGLFRKIFFISQDEIPGSDLLSDDHVRSMLHGAEIGMPPGVVEKARAELITSMESIYKPSGRKKQINELLTQIKEIDEDIRGYDTLSQKYDQLNGKILDLQKETGQLQNKKSRLIERLEHISKIIAYKKDYERYLELEEILRKLPDTDRIPEGAYERFQKLIAQRQDAERRIKTIKENIQKTADIDMLDNWEKYLREKEKILELWHDKKLYEQNNLSLHQLEDNIREFNSDFENIPLDVISYAESTGDQFSGTLPSYEDVLSRSKPVTDAYNRELELQNKKAEIIRDLEDLKKSFNETKTTYLKVKEFEESKSFERKKPNSILIAAGLIIIGVILSLLGLVSSQIFFLTLLLILGIFCIIAGGVLYLKTGSQSQSGPVDKQESDRLRDLLTSKKNRFNVLKENLAQQQKESEKAISLHKSMVQDWESWLASYHVPLTLNIQQVSILFSQAEKVKTLSEDLQKSHEKAEELKTAILSYEQKVSYLANILQYPVYSNISDLIELIYQKFQSVEKQHQEWSKTMAVEDQLTHDLKKEETSFVTLKEDIENLLESAGCTTEEDFQSVSSQKIVKQQYEQEKQILLNRFSGINGGESTGESGIEFLKFVDFPCHYEEKKEIEKDLENIEGLINKGMEDIGRYKGECEQIESDSGGTDLRIQRDVLVNTFQNLAEKWSVYKIALNLLDAAVKKYEDKRQPAVVQQAEQIFLAITGGRYQTISIPASKPDIYVKDTNGIQKEITELSRGTAEQLYLALRFGYIREFQKSAENMPIILDEILVNFDPERTREACKAIAQMSETNQILYFTCHPDTVANLYEAIPDAWIIDLNQDLGGIDPPQSLEGGPIKPVTFLDDKYED